MIFLCELAKNPGRVAQAESNKAKTIQGPGLQESGPTSLGRAEEQHDEEEEKTKVKT